MDVDRSRQKCNFGLASVRFWIGSRKYQSSILAKQYLHFKEFTGSIERFIDVLFYFSFTLEKVESFVSNDSNDICAVGKHLCGGATGLSLRCLSGMGNNGEGLVF